MVKTRIDPTLHGGAPPSPPEEEPAPITQRDPYLQAAPPAAPAAPPPSPAGRRLAVAAAVLAAVALVAAVAVYLFVIRYEAHARRHVPSNAVFVAHADLADLALFPPVRDRLLVLLLTRASTGATRGDRIREATGVRLGTDLREIVVASTDATSWVLLAGGRIARGRFVDGLADLAREEGWIGFHKEGDLLIGPGGVAIGQAEDGTIVVGTDVAIASAALPATDEHRRLELPEGGAVTCAIGREGFRGAAGRAWLGRGEVLGKIDRASGRLDLGSAPSLTLTLEPGPGVQAAELARDLDALLADARKAAFVLPDVAGLRGALDGATVTARGEEVSLVAPWPYDALDRGCERLAGMFGGGE